MSNARCESYTGEYENCRRGQLPLRQFSCQAEHVLKPKEFVPVCFGGPEETRTLDLSDANRTLSQLSYRPILNSAGIL